jgi:PPP family 3-phenylpropionic acid transporter
MAALARLAPEGARGRAQGVLAASMAVASAAATVLSGVLYRSFGPFVFLAMVPLAAAGFAIAACIRVAPARQPQSAGEGG